MKIVKVTSVALMLATSAVAMEENGSEKSGNDLRKFIEVLTSLHWSDGDAEAFAKKKKDQEWINFSQKTYKDDFDPTLIFMDENLVPNNIFLSHKLSQNTITPVIIANNEGYLEKTWGDDALPGRRFTMPDGDDTEIPIGYNIFLPKDVEIKGILVTVYGGGCSVKYEPSLNEPFDTFIKNGYAFIMLNLPDILELDVYQMEMPKQLLDKVQKCITYFGKILKENPERFAKNDEQKELLNSLFGKKVFLHGSSFGGMMTILQASRKNTPYDGFISHDGVLSRRMHAMSMRSSFCSHRYHDPNNIKSHLCSLPLLGDITKPMLLLQNMDDCAVNAKNLFDAYEKIDTLDNVSIYITPRGNPILSGRSTYKGHFLPEGEALTSYMRAFLSFMDHAGQPPEEHFTHPKEAEAYNLLANRNYREATVEERCMGELFHQYLLNLRLEKHTDPNDVEEKWSELYQPMVENFYRAFLHTKLLTTTHSIKVTDLYSGVRCSDFFTCSKREKERLLRQEVSRDSSYTYKKAVDNHLGQFLSFMKEHHFPKDVNVEELKEFLKNPDREKLKDALASAFQDKFLSSLKDPQFSSSPFYLEQFYRVNPEILKDDSVMELYFEEKENIEKELSDRKKLTHKISSSFKWALSFVKKDLKRDTEMDFKTTLIDHYRDPEYRLELIDALQPENVSEALQQIKDKFIDFIEHLTEVPKLHHEKSLLSVNVPMLSLNDLKLKHPID